MDIKPPYRPVPVDVCRQIAGSFNKSVVIVLAWDQEHQKLHTTTYGVSPADKINAANGGETCAKALGMDCSKSVFNEDFRTVDAAKNARIRELVSRAAIPALRSYQLGNCSPELANEVADALEALL